MITKDFITGGNAILTVSAPDIHYTFKIRRPKPDMPFFINLLTGPQNTSDYTYLGIYDPVTDTVRTTAKSKFGMDSRPVKAISWAVRIIGKGGAIRVGYKIQHEGRCGCCGRLLTVPESIESGIGPECAKRRGYAQSSSRSNQAVQKDDERAAQDSQNGVHGRRAADNSGAADTQAVEAYQ